MYNSDSARKNKKNYKKYFLYFLVFLVLGHARGPLNIFDTQFKKKKWIY